MTWPLDPNTITAGSSGHVQDTRDIISRVRELDTFAVDADAKLAAFSPEALAATFTSKVERVRALSPIKTLATALHNGFAHAVQAPNGSWVVTWREGSNHAPSKGVIKVHRFRDDGTLSVTATAATDATYDLRDPCLTVLADGRIAMSVFVYDQTIPAPLLNGCRVAFSTDNGATFGAFVTVPSADTVWAAVAGPIVETTPGTLLMPTYGQSAGDSGQVARVSRSTDNGVTWAAHGTMAAGGGRSYQEPNIAVLGDGSLLGMVRSEPSPFNVVAVRSTNGGATWTAPVVAFAGSGSPRTTEQAGFLTALFRNPSTGRTITRSSPDNGTTWSEPFELPYTSAKPSCTYGVAVPFGSNSLRYFYSLQSPDSITADVVQVDAIVPEDRPTPGLVGCRLRSHTSNPTIPSATSTAIPMTTEEVDTHGFHSTTSNQTRIVIPAGMAGWYRLTGNVQFAANATGQRQIVIAKNGTLGGAVPAISNVPAQATLATSVQAQADMVYLAVGDFVELYAYQDSGAALAIRYEATTLTASLVQLPL